MPFLAVSVPDGLRSGGGVTAGGAAVAGGSAAGGSAAGGMAADAVIALRVLTKEMRHLEAAASVVEWAALADEPAGAARSPKQLALQLQIAQHEAELSHDHLNAAMHRAKMLQANLVHKDAELHRAHMQMVDHMRQSGTLLGTLASLHHGNQAINQIAAQAEPTLTNRVSDRVSLGLRAESGSIVGVLHAYGV